ncbi:hypothetical protein NQ317_016962, partial [Molorchus minor]
YYYCLILFSVSDIKSVVFVILSQENKYHLKQAENLTNDIIQQASIYYKVSRKSGLATHYMTKKQRLSTILLFTKIQSFFQYPNIASGFAVSRPLLTRLSERVNKITSSDFSIDISHELALFIWNKGGGLGFATRACIIMRTSELGDVVPKTSLFFAVKTCKKFHKDRVPVLKVTWVRHTTKIRFFSDEKDDSVPTINLGVPNTDQGHCGKTIEILRYITRKIRSDKDVRWIVLVDDDTILSKDVSRIQQLLTCYDASEEVALGERYGYNVHSFRGYNYITGGGGMVFSRPLLDKLAKDGVCECPSLNTPDDMFLGICIGKLGVSVTHSPFFHQARPVDYAPGYLETQVPVSFHKHWMINPIAVYRKWFADSDNSESTNVANHAHSEL